MLIAVEGCIGAGKTTVAVGLAQHRQCPVLLEDFEANPFIEAFYADRQTYATETEFAFLLLHYHHLKMHTLSTSSSELVCDYSLDKDLLYARLNLECKRTEQVFGELHHLLADELPKVGMLVFLDASATLIRDRIAARARAYELGVEPQYIRSIVDAYGAFYANHKGPKIRVPMDEWDFVKEPACFERLSRLIDKKLQ